MKRVYLLTIVDKEHNIEILYYSDYIINDYKLGKVYNNIDELLNEILSRIQNNQK